MSSKKNCPKWIAIHLAKNVKEVQLPELSKLEEVKEAVEHATKHTLGSCETKHLFQGHHVPNMENQTVGAQFAIRTCNSKMLDLKQ